MTIVIIVVWEANSWDCVPRTGVRKIRDRKDREKRRFLYCIAIP